MGFTKRVAPGAVTDETVRELTRGYAFFQQSSLEALRVAWHQCEHWLLPEFIEANPGRRPFAWWVFTHQQERPVLNDFVSDACKETLRAKHHGFLHTSICDKWHNYLQMPEVDYLATHGLLTETERSALEH